MESTCHVGDLDLCYETFGDPEHPTMLLVMGLGTQMLGWPEDFCKQLAARGYLVVRFDNRDCGRSSAFDGHRPPGRRELATRRIRETAYGLDDMAGDVASLLDHLEVGAAHVIGASMGGMIAQTLATQSPDRVLSLVSMMSNTGSRRSGQPALSLMPMLLRQAPRDKERYVEHMLRAFRLVGSPGFEFDEADLRTLFRASHDRGVNPDGTARQLGAIFAAGDRTTSLRTIRAPTLVIHGTADRLIAPSGGRATARAIPGAHLLLLGGMGHDLPRPLWSLITNAIVGNAESAGGATPGPPAAVDVALA